MLALGIFEILERLILVLQGGVFLAGCATADRVKALEEKVASLEEKIEEVAKSGGKAAPRDEKAEKAAAAPCSYCDA